MYTVWGYDDTDEYTEFETYSHKSDAIDEAKRALHGLDNWFATTVTTTKGGKRIKVWDSDRDYWPFRA